MQLTPRVAVLLLALLAACSSSTTEGTSSTIPAMTTLVSTTTTRATSTTASRTTIEVSQATEVELRLCIDQLSEAVGLLISLGDLSRAREADPVCDRARAMLASDVPDIANSPEGDLAVLIAARRLALAEAIVAAQTSSFTTADAADLDFAGFEFREEALALLP